MVSPWDAVVSAGPQVSFAHDSADIERYAEIADSFPAETTTPRRKRAFVGIGSSTSGRGARDADEMLAEGFGRD